MKVSSSLNAAISMSLGALFLSLVPVFIKLIPAESGIPTVQKIFMRGLVAAVVLAVVLAARGISFKPGNSGMLLARSIFGMGAMWTYFLAVEGIQMAEAVTINKLSPFFVLLLSWIFLGEKLTKLHFAAIVLGFSGIVVIVRPGSIPVTLPAMLAIVSAVLSGAAYTTLRALRKSDRPIIVVFWFSVAITVSFLPPTLVKGVIPDFMDLLSLLGIGLCGAAGQLFMTRAYRFAPGGEVAVYGYLSVVFSMLWQMVFFHSVPGPALLAGAGLVLVGGWLSYVAGNNIESS